MTVNVAASAFVEALPKVSLTRLALDPVSFRCVTRRSAKASVSLPAAWKYAATARAAGKTDRNEYSVAAEPELRLASK